MTLKEGQLRWGLRRDTLCLCAALFLTASCAVLEDSDGMMEIDIIKSKISTAFGEGQFPTNAKLLYDENCTHEECVYLNRIIGRRSWKNIAHTTKPYRDDIFFFFSLEAFHYYLPAFMFIVLDKYEEADVMVDAFLRSLQRRGETGTLQIETLAQGRILFSEKQYRAIASFLSYVCTKHSNVEACSALKEGWGQYAD